MARRDPCDNEEVVLAEFVQPLAQLRDSFSDLFPPDWFQFLQCRGAVGIVEARDIVQRVLTSDEEDFLKFQVSWVELVFYLVVVLGCGDQCRGRTLSSWVTCIRQVLRPLLIRFGARGWLSRGSVFGCFVSD